MMKKVFIVGCPRSGTTLLQSFLASHQNVISFPETHLYSKTISINPFIRAVTVYGNKHLKITEGILNNLGLTKDESFNAFKTTLKTGRFVEFLNTQLNRIGEHYSESGEEYLLEKTPRHLHYIDLIQKAETSSIFIHLIRNGEDVVASMSEATSNNPEKWSGERSIKTSVYWWNRSIRISKKYIGKTNNIHVRYENLLEDPEHVLRFLCEKIGLNYDEKIISNYHKTARSLINEEETWKEKNTKNTLRASKKFNSLPLIVQKRIKAKLIDFDYGTVDISSNI